MQKQNFSQGGFMLKNIQYYRKTKYPDKVAKPKCLVFVRIFLFCSVGIKIQYFPTAPFIVRARPCSRKRTNKPPAMRVVEKALALCKKPPNLI